MKKVFMMIALMAIPFAMQAQTKFHDVEANEAQGPVKSITTTMMGNSRTINFTEDGKMVVGEITDAVYDADGYIQSAKMSIQGQSTDVKFLWENGRLQGQVINVMGNDLKIINKYDEKGVITGTSIDMGGQIMDSPYSDIKLDDHGNWISRKASMMGQEMENTRTIVYY
jgi:hypothetical protein